MRALGFEIAEDELQRLRAMDDLSALPRLYALGQAAAERQLDEAESLIFRKTKSWFCFWGTRMIRRKIYAWLKILS
jgi:hypothetical protein